MASNTYQTSIVDLPSSIDSFDLENYINGLSHFINHCATPLTIAIQGDWGTGKTSIMSQVEQILLSNESCKVKTVLFNTWQYSQFNMDHELSLSFISDLTQQLLKNRNPMTEGINSIITTLVKSVKFVDIPLVDTEKVSDSLVEKVDNFLKRNDDIKNLKSRFQKIVNETLECDGLNKLVIFIDDLDRLVPARAVELLEILKLFLDCENCVFVLAIDYNVVTTGVRNKYGDDVDPTKGKAFFDKLIQVPFTVPVSNYNINKFLETSLSSLNINLNNVELKLVEKLIRNSIGNNPRSINRLLNSFSLLQCIFEKKLRAQQVNSGNRILLLALVCLQFSFEETYNWLVENRQDIDEVNTLLLLNFDENDSENKDCVELLQPFMSIFIELFEFNSSGQLTEESHANLLNMLELSNTVVVTTKENKQNHTVNEDVQYIIRHIFNDISIDNKIVLSEPHLFGSESKGNRLATVNQSIIPGASTLRLTQGKGQGLYIYFENSNVASYIYFSGDYTGKMVNDGLSICKGKNVLYRYPSKFFKEFKAEEIRDDDALYTEFYKKLINAINECYRHAEASYRKNEEK